MPIAVPLLWKSHSTELALKRFVTWVLAHVVHHIWHLIELAFANLALELLVLPASLLVDDFLGAPELFCFFRGLSERLVLQLHSIERTFSLLLLRHLNCNLIIASIVVFWICVLHGHHLRDLLVDRWNLLVVFHCRDFLCGDHRFTVRLLVSLDESQHWLRWNSCCLVLRWLKNACWRFLLFFSSHRHYLMCVTLWNSLTVNLFILLLNRLL